MAENELKQKSGKQSNSLVWRLTASSLSRSFWQLLGVNILVIVLFTGGLAAHTEWTASRILPALLTGGEVPELYNIEYWTDTSAPRGMEIKWGDGWIPDYPRSRRQIYATDATSLRSTLDTLRYTIHIPLEGDQVAHLSFFWQQPALIFTVCFMILWALEFLGWLTSIFKIRRSMRRTLRPIYELTRTAQTIQTDPKRPSRQEDLHLSGAIATLNTITENRLDTRILIGDEREELRGLAAAINSMLDRLDAAYQSQLRFVSDASHELRTPIAVIQGYANLLDRWGKEDEKTLQESIDAIKAEAMGMQDLVEQLLFLARSDNNSIQMKTENLDLSALAAEVVYEAQMIDPHHNFTSNLAPSLPVCGDAQLLKQALRIFVDNSIKYTPAGEAITLTTRLDGDRAQVSVTDEGIGIPGEELPHVFDRFFRADESRARETGGTGLGLSIAHWIIDRHGGHVDLLSRKDLGTRITAVLPAGEAKAETPV